MRVDALLPAIRGLTAERVRLGAPQDPDRLEVRRLEQDVLRRGRDLGLLAAHDPGEPDGTLAVGDHKILGVQRPLDALERAQRFSRSRPARDETALDEVEVVGVERTAEGEHHVVRDVDDVRDRPHARAAEPPLQPERRLTDGDVAKRPPDESEAGLWVVDRNLDRFVAVALRILTGHRQQLAAQ